MTKNKIIFGRSPTEASSREWFTFLLAFQRWTSLYEKRGDDRDRVIPPYFALNLRKLLYEPDVSLNNLPDTFHFNTLGRTASNRFNSIYEFSLLSPDEGSVASSSPKSNANKLLRIRCVRSYDNDIHTIDVSKREVTSVTGHYMSVRQEETKPWMIPSMGPGKNAKDWSSASHVLHRQWIAPDRWIDENRNYLLLRPQTATRHHEMICNTANEMLSKGYSMLLFYGPPHVTVPLLVAGEKLCIAGMLWRDNDTTHISDVPDGFALILAEGAPRHSTFQNNLFVWTKDHVYELRSGLWH
mmetsp:Transcript_2978/g.4464  ORF Transcript_2978/g.4464 Transcript_2978/m.4464 type:complete len:298 (-) Transcript_2978:211-1104(-)